MLRKVIYTWCLLILNTADSTSSHDEDQSSRKIKLQQTPAMESGGELWGFHLGKKAEKHCLTGYMTDVQTWVDENGNLNPDLDIMHSIDVSSRHDPIVTLQQSLQGYRGVSRRPEVKYLGMSKCKLKRVPTVFTLADSEGRTLYSTVEYLTLYGNEFAAVSDAGVDFVETMNATNALEFTDVTVRWPGPTLWAAGLNQVTFNRLKELDLRKCNIQQLTDDLFKNMPMLEALYLGENHISFVAANAFRGLKKLIHLDLSRNNYETEDKGMIFEHRTVFKSLKSLRSLDLSSTIMSQRDINIFRDLQSLTRLSICYTGLVILPKGVFNNTSIRFLDLSGNNGILNGPKHFEGIENTLEVLYAKEVGLKNFDMFYKLDKLQILDIEYNEVSIIPRSVTMTLTNLRILNLNSNRIMSWFGKVFGYIKTLQLLSLRDNNINVITPEMIEDMQNVTYVGLSGNFIVCNCHTREMFEIAYRNENKTYAISIFPRVKDNIRFNFHRGFNDFNEIIQSRNTLVRWCESRYCPSNEEIESEGNFLLFDFKENTYQCLDVTESKSVPFSQVNTCSEMKREADYLEVITESKRRLLALLTIPAVLLPILIFCYIFRRNLKYFCITIKNSATLSLINQDKAIDVSDGTIFHYDVFVSYCNDDRNWVLDELLPNVEKGCNISVCLHERDFQVGLSILENIVSCMDRSRSIMLIISKQFLMSQWCQFEMHLAQHRLLETRREDLILVLLEDIPRRLRPTTLHYLMLTKTYIVWPKKDGEKPSFWKRLSRSILARRQVCQDNISLA